MLGLAVILAALAWAPTATPAPAPAALAIRAGDVAGSSVAHETRARDVSGSVAFERAFVGGRVGSTSLAHWESIVTVTASSRAAAQLFLGEWQIASARSRAVTAHLFRDTIGSDARSGSRIVSAALERSRRLALGDGAAELQLVVRATGTRYSARPLDFRFDIAFVRAGRAVGMLLLLSPPGQTLTADAVATLVQVAALRLDG